MRALRVATSVASSRNALCLLHQNRMSISRYIVVPVVCIHAAGRQASAR